MQGISGSIFDCIPLSQLLVAPLLLLLALFHSLGAFVVFAFVRFAGGSALVWLIGRSACRSFARSAASLLSVCTAMILPGKNRFRIFFYYFRLGIFGVCLVLGSHKVQQLQLLVLLLQVVFSLPCCPAPLAQHHATGTRAELLTRFSFVCGLSKSGSERSAGHRFTQSSFLSHLTHHHLCRGHRSLLRL